MRLILENFRCYRGVHTFDIVDDGITLISGASGAGKTTLLMALHFVITGNSPPKVIADGYDSCRVTLETLEFSVCRTKRPNRVVILGLNLEDDLAQQFIYRHFGKFFEITSYIQQQYQRTFLYQSPAEKLEILEKLCFDETNIQPEELKKNCSAILKSLNAQHIALKSKHATLMEWCKTVITQPREILLPSEQYLGSLLDQLDKTKKLENKYYTQITNQSKKQEYVDQILELHTQLQNISDCKYTENELNTHLYTLQEMNKLHFHPTWEKHSQEDCESLIADYTRDIAYHQEYRDLSEKICKQEEIEKKIQTLRDERHAIECLSEGTYECPQCNAVLSLIGKKLLPKTSRLSKTITPEQKKGMIQKLDDQLENLLPRIKSLEHYRERQTQLKDLIDLSEQLSDLKTDHQWINEYYEENTKRDIQNNMNQERKQLLVESLLPGIDSSQVKQWLEQLHKKEQLQRQVQHYQQLLDQLYEQLQDFDPELNLETIQKQRQQVERSIDYHKEQTHAYKMYQVELERYNAYSQNLVEAHNLSKQITLLEKRMSAVSELKQLILKTESEVIDQKTLEISNLVNTYCSQIFIEPITVELRTTKKTSTQSEKVQIQLEVYYKNMKCDVSLLSGGEQARLNLAFVLAFAHVFHSPILLLDECTSNLDQELVETVIEQIDSIGIPKVILIAHQIVEGNFKQILKVQ
jgi:DNA repair exonuclease SbcCD ATPase subunit